MSRPLLLAGFALLSSVGCVTVTPLGPLVKTYGNQPISLVGKKPAPPPAPGADPLADLPPAPAPIPPAEMITPGEVSAANHQDAVQRLSRELNADRQTMPPPSRTAEISRYKGGVKVQ